MTNYPVCSSGVHCSFCRIAENTSFRKSLAELKLIPEQAVSSDCPFGKGPLVPKGSAIHIPESKPVPVPASSGPIQSRQPICNRCDEFNGNVCELVFGCGVCLGKWIRFLNNNTSKCPLGKW